MNIDEIKKQKEDVKNDIRDFTSSYSQTVEESKKEINQENYQKILKFYDRYSEIGRKIFDLTSSNKINGNIIEKVENGKIIAPLVPIEDVIEGMTEENFEELKKIYDEINAFLETECKTFDKYYEIIEKDVSEYHEKLEELEYSEERIKPLLLESGDSKGIEVNIEHPELVKYNSFRYRAPIKIYTSEKVAELYEKYGIGVSCFNITNAKYDDPEPDLRYRKSFNMYSRISFTPYAECDVQGKQSCKEIEKRFEELRNSEDEKLDEPGMVSLKVRKGISFCKENIKVNVTQRELINAGILPEDMGWKTLEQVKEEDKKLDEPGMITLKVKKGLRVCTEKKYITQRELIDLGVSPEDMGWKSLEQIKEKKLQVGKKGKVSRKDILEADEKYELTTTQVGGFKGFIDKLLDRFKGKGEK